ncbi:MAG TPA: transporter substrate-binding domain-containing protein [Opitutaceae bacterium]|nr:transporter substrate-binding domain-containing protein [Opitutaceae bacterium]
MRPCSCVVFLCLALIANPHRSAAASLRVGFETNNDPISFAQKDGRPAGFIVDVVEAAAKEVNLTVEPVIGKWDEVFARFKAGEIDAMASLAYSPERDQFIDFSIAHLRLDGALYVRKGDRTTRTLADVRNRRIALPRGGFTEEYLTKQGMNQHFVFVPSLAAALQSLDKGECDVVAATAIIANSFLRENYQRSIEVSPVVLPGFFYELRMGVRAGDSERLALLNDGLARIRANGTYHRIYEKWMGPLGTPRVRLRDLQPFLLPASLVLIAVLGALVWQRRLLRRMAGQAAALHQSEERLTLVLKGSEDGFWDWDLQTGRIERSERWAEMLGYRLSEIEPTLAGGLKLVHPDDRWLCENFRSPDHMQKSGRDNIEFRMRTKSGEWRWILNRGKVVARTPDGKPLRVAGTHTDITDLKRAQTELTRQEAQFRFIYEQAPVGLSWVRRREADTRMVNAAHERITGVSAAKSRDTQNYVAATHPEDREPQRVLLERLYRGEIEHFSLEKRYVHPDGRTVWAMMSTHLYRDPVTKEPQEVTTLVDITTLKTAVDEREKLQLKMLDSQKLESLGVLAGGIAHDFNNLLTVILANASMIRGEVNDPHARAQHLAHVETAARRAADLCRQMLAYAGRGSFVVDRVDLGRFLTDTAQLLQVSISKKARLTLKPTPDLPPVEADIAQLQQVVMNLVINASDALGDTPGEITLSTRRGRPKPNLDGVVHSFDLPEGECVCLEVADTGHGMSPATLSRVFDPFFTTKFAGRGLGLAAVLGIVRAHHGALTVESTPGKGSRFSLYLPATSPAVERATKGTRPPIPVADAEGTILVADDEPVVLATADQLLRRCGYKTVLASDGQEAVEQFRINPNGFAAVLLDLTMPRIDGAEALRIIRGINPHVRVLLMSGYSEQDVLARIRDQGPVPVLRKPFTHDVLLARLAEVIAS